MDRCIILVSVTDRSFERSVFNGYLCVVCWLGLWHSLENLSVEFGLILVAMIFSCQCMLM